MATVLEQMLSAAAQSAGASWNTIRPQLTAFAQQIIQATAGTAAELAAKRITQAEAKIEFDQISDFTAIVSDYADVAIRATAQAAFNAAIDVLWKVITGAVPTA